MQLNQVGARFRSNDLEHLLLIVDQHQGAVLGSPDTQLLRHLLCSSVIFCLLCMRGVERSAPAEVASTRKLRPPRFTVSRCCQQLLSSVTRSPGGEWLGPAWGNVGGAYPRETPWYC